MKGYTPKKPEPGEPISAEDEARFREAALTNAQGDGVFIMVSRSGNGITISGVDQRRPLVYAKLTGEGQTTGSYTAEEVHADGSAKTNGLTFDSSQSGDNIVGDLYDINLKTSWYNSSADLIVRVVRGTDTNGDPYWVIDHVLGTTASLQTRSRSGLTVSTKVWDRRQANRGDGGDGFKDKVVLDPAIGGSPTGVTFFSRDRTHDSLGAVEKDDGATEDKATVRGDAADSPKDGHLTVQDDSASGDVIGTVKLNQPQDTSTSITLSAATGAGITINGGTSDTIDFDDSGRNTNGDKTLELDLSGGSGTDTHADIQEGGSDVQTDTSFINFDDDDFDVSANGNGADVALAALVAKFCSTPSDGDLFKWDASNGCLQATTIEAELKTISGYNASNEQYLKNNNGTLTWLDKASC